MEFKYDCASGIFDKYCNSWHPPFLHHEYHDMQTNKYTHAHTEIYTIHKWEEYEFSHVIQMEKNNFK